jgi:hypothetical protein
MGTRCNIKITDGQDTLWFYRHYDGYPSSVMPDLAHLMGRLRRGELRDNVGQFSGHLIVLGAEDFNRRVRTDYDSWKCGHYEPTTGEHGDIEWLYVFELHHQTCLGYHQFSDAIADVHDPLTWED